MFTRDNEEVPLRSLDQQAEIRRHLFHNIAASWFPKAAGFAQKAEADIWAAAKAFPSWRATALELQVLRRTPRSFLAWSVTLQADGTNAGRGKINLSHFV